MLQMSHMDSNMNFQIWRSDKEPALIELMWLANTSVFLTIAIFSGKLSQYAIIHANSRVLNDSLKEMRLDMKLRSQQRVEGNVGRQCFEWKAMLDRMHSAWEFIPSSALSQYD